MKPLLLDTSVCVEIIRGKNFNIDAHFQRTMERGNARLMLSSIVEHELLFGIENGGEENREKNTRKLNSFLKFPFERLAFDNDDARLAALIRHRLKSKSLGAYDLLIASQAVSKDLTLVTGNVREFSRVQDLDLVNWNRTPD